ncbi:9675_t:CDS:1, partial [Cetraspora pellucida]
SNAGKPKEHTSEMPKDKNKIRKPGRLKKISKLEGQKKKSTQLRLSKKLEDQRRSQEISPKIVERQRKLIN